MNVSAKVCTGLIVGTFGLVSAGSVWAQQGPEVSAGAANAEISGKCEPTRLAYRTVEETLESTTTSQGFVDLEKTGVKFKTSAKSCVAVRFSALTYAVGSDAFEIRVMLDGVTAFFPARVQFAGDDNSSYAHARSFEFVLADVPKGKHKVVVQWHTIFGDPVYIYARNTVVQYK
jgi:hypothetical protein